MASRSKVIMRQQETTDLGEYYGHDLKTSTLIYAFLEFPLFSFYFLFLECRPSLRGAISFSSLYRHP